MKLTYFSVKNYRSIADAVLDELGSSTILIGPNNEGKSNVLQALNTCLTLLSVEQPVKAGPDIRLRYDRTTYDWATDFPIKKQLSTPDGSSVFELHFKLSEKEQAAFEAATGSTLNDVLPIELTFLANSYANFKVRKPGKGGTALSRKAESICRFVSSTLDFAYIPAVRTAEASLEVVTDLVRRELRQLEKNPRYAELQDELSKLQKPILDLLASRLKSTLKEFLGSSLNDVTLKVSERSRAFGLGRSCKITIDDGTPTLLERKGDGVQSLVAISLLSGTLQDTDSDKDIILLLEEPESHLHPRAIHQLREVLDSLRQENQLFVTTHCPLLVNRASVSGNHIVSKNKASRAKSLEELRDVLGVRASDNLQHAALVLVVEGPGDERALRPILSTYSTNLAEAFRRGSIAFHQLGGAAKLPYSLSLLQSFMCTYYCVLDDDSEGRGAFKEASAALLASPANTTFTTCLGLVESEFEDLLAEEIYADYFQTQYSVDVRHAPFKGKGKWSVRLRQGLAKCGKPWGEPDESRDKRAIAELVASNPATALHPAREGVIKSLAQTLETKLSALAAGVR